MKVSQNLEDVSIGEGVSVIDAMLKLNKSFDQTLFIIDLDNHLLGTLTDGDLRRSIINGADLHSAIESIYHKEPYFLYENKVDEKDIRDLFKKELLKVV